MTKKELAKYLGDFTKEHGVDEATKVLSRMLLGIAHSLEADTLEFNDEGVGSVVVTPTYLKSHLIN